MKLIINFASKLGVDTVSRLIGFVTLPLITRALGPEGYGQFTYLFVILSYFGFFIDFGYLSYGTNKLCDKVDSKVIIGKIISLQLLTLVFTLLVLIISGYFIFDTERYFLLLIFSLTYVTQIFAIKYYYLANNKLYFNSMAELAGQLVYAGLIFLMFNNFPTVFTLIIFSVIQSLITSVFLFLPYSRKNKITLELNPKLNYITFKEAYKLGLSSKAEGITSSFVILSIGFFLNNESVGLYNASYKIYLILLTVVQGASYTIMPMLLKKAKSMEINISKKISLIFYVFVIIGIFLSASTFFFSETIISLMFGPQFSESVFILKVISLTLLIMPVWMFMVLILLAYNSYNLILLVSISSTVLSVVLSLLFINLFGIDGAAFVLPFVSAGTILICIFSLRRISVQYGFRIAELFSFKSALEEMKLHLKISNSH